MSRDDIIRMAREAGPLTKGPFDDWCDRFANLVAAAEREECAKLLEEYPYWLGTVGKREIAATIRARGNK